MKREFIEPWLLLVRAGDRDRDKKIRCLGFCYRVAEGKVEKSNYQTIISFYRKLKSPEIFGSLYLYVRTFLCVSVL